jgi:hypothetical protein
LGPGKETDYSSGYSPSAHGPERLLIHWLARANSASLFSEGYQIHMKNPLHSDDLVCMSEILSKYGLALKIRNDLTIIYRPDKQKK